MKYKFDWFRNTSRGYLFGLRFITCFKESHGVLKIQKMTKLSHICGAKHKSRYLCLLSLQKCNLWHTVTYVWASVNILVLAIKERISWQIFKHIITNIISINNDYPNWKNTTRNKFYVIEHNTHISHTGCTGFIHLYPQSIYGMFDRFAWLTWAFCCDNFSQT